MDARRKALLAELSRDRTERGVDPATRGRGWLAAAVLVIGVAAAAVWLTTGGGERPAAAAAASTGDGRSVAEPAPAPPRPVATRTVLDGSGHVIARRQSTVSARTTSRVLEVRVEEGMTVEQGQILAIMDAANEEAELALATAELAAARAARAELVALIANAERALQRAEVLEDKGLLSTAELDARVAEASALRARLDRAGKEIEVATEGVAVQQTRLHDLVIRAPFAGVVVEKSVQPGEIISPVSAGGGFTRTGIATIVDMSSLEVGVDVNEAYIDRVFSGQPVEIRLNAYPDRIYTGRVLAVVPSADRSKATIPVRIAIDTLDARVLPQMGVQVGFFPGTSQASAVTRGTIPSALRSSRAGR
jgi:RND family efflux transporter MFP subunit